MSSPPTLLLADDSVAIQRIVALTFADQPLRLVVAKDGQDAINRMAAERPDIVLADTNMPCVDGYELARWVRQQPHLDRVPVLLLAGATDPVDEQRLHDSGANGVLEKPFEPNHVISRVKELLGMKGAPAPEPTRFIPPPHRPPAAAREPGPLVAPTDAGLLAEPPGDAAAAVGLEAGGEAGSGPDTDVVVETTGEGRVAEMEASGDLEVEPPRPPTTAGAAADVFERLLAAEQGDPAALGALQAPPVLSDESLDAIATRLQARLARAVNDSVAGEMRAAVAEALQAAVDGSLLGTVRGAVQEEVARTLPPAVQAAVAPVVRDEVAAAIHAAVRDAVERALPDALTAATQAAMAEVVPGVVRDTAERLVRDEIARIRGIGA